jgi:hypothetical protein
MDITVDLDWPSPGAALFEGVHKAYATLCRLRFHGPAPQFGLLLTEKLTVRFDGTAYGNRDWAALEFGTAGGHSVLVRSAQELASCGIVERPTAELIFRTLADLLCVEPPDSLSEVEFLLDGELSFIATQQRRLERAPDGPAPFQTPGGFTGPATDLRGRLPARLPDIAPGTASIVSVQELFGLLWIGAAPGALVITRDRGSHAGMPTHLRWLASALLPRTPQFYLPDSQVAPGDGQITIVCDGIDARVSRGLR